MLTRRGTLLVLLGVASLSSHAQAQAPDEYSFRTLASIKPESTARFNNPQGVAVGADGTIYVADTDNHTIRKMTPAGEVTTLAGLAGTSGSADGVGTAARFSLPTGIAVDGSGTLYVADRGNSTIRKITPPGTVTTLAGAPLGLGPTYLNGIGTEARFELPSDLAVDSTGTVYVADTYNCAIRKITPEGIVTTFAGPGPSGAVQCQNVLFGSTAGFVDGVGTAARFRFPVGVAVDNAGIVYVADTGNSAIRKITQAGVVSTLTRVPESLLASPTAIAVHNSGTLYVADAGDSRIKKVSTDGTVTTLAGSSTGSADGSGSAAQFNNPSGIDVDAAETAYVGDTWNHTIRKITAGGVVTTLAGKPLERGSSDSVKPSRFTGVAVDSARVVYATDASSHSVVKITSTGTVSTLAGVPGTSGTADSGAGATFSYPGGIAVDGAGTIYVTESSTIRKITASGGVSTLAGLAGAYGITDGPGSAARFRILRGAAVDSGGTLYVADGFNFTIRKVTPGGIVTTFAGWPGATGSVDGTGIAARFASPQGVAVDASGNVYVADGDTIRKITPGGVVTTLAGLAGSPGSEDGTGGAPLSHSET